MNICQEQCQLQAIFRAYVCLAQQSERAASFQVRLPLDDFAKNMNAHLMFQSDRKSDSCFKYTGVPGKRRQKFAKVHWLVATLLKLIKFFSLIASTVTLISNLSKKNNNNRTSCLAFEFLHF